MEKLALFYFFWEDSFFLLTFRKVDGRRRDSCVELTEVQNEDLLIRPCLYLPYKFVNYTGSHGTEFMSNDARLYRCQAVTTVLLLLLQCTAVNWLSTQRWRTIDVVASDLRRSPQLRDSLDGWRVKNLSFTLSHASHLCNCKESCAICNICFKIYNMYGALLQTEVSKSTPIDMPAAR